MSVLEEQGDDDAYMIRAERELYGSAIKKLLAIPGHSKAAKRFLERLDLRVNMLRQMPEAGEIDRLKDIAWACRRRASSSSGRPK